MFFNEISMMFKSITFKYDQSGVNLGCGNLTFDAGMMSSNLTFDAEGMHGLVEYQTTNART